MWKTGDREYQSLVIHLGISDKEFNYKEECERLISEHLLVAQNDGWQPTIPTDFDYLEKNGVIRTHRKENWIKTLFLGFIPSMLGIPPVVVQNTVYESVSITLAREAKE